MWHSEIIYLYLSPTTATFEWPAVLTSIAVIATTVSLNGLLLPFRVRGVTPFFSLPLLEVQLVQSLEKRRQLSEPWLTPLKAELLHFFFRENVALLGNLQMIKRAKLLVCTRMKGISANRFFSSFIPLLNDYVRPMLRCSTVKQHLYSSIPYEQMSGITVQPVEFP